MDTLDCLVIGAGVVGLAVARELALQGREVIVVEKETSFGTGASSRNSEVIHAGIYYPQHSLKARYCVRGQALLYRYCEARDVAHQRIGKLIVASTASELPSLSQYLERGCTNGAAGLRLLDRRQTLALEPALDVAGSLYSPNTGIVDSHALMLAMIADIEATGGHVVYQSPVISGTIDSGGALLVQLGGISNSTLRCQYVVNAAGLYAANVAQSLGLQQVPRLRFARGNYFDYQATSPFGHLVYPVAESGGLGIHATLDLGGRLRFGPDVEWLEESAAHKTPANPENFSYTVDVRRRDMFANAIRRYFPNLDTAQLAPAYSGIRSKYFAGAGSDAVVESDFAIETASDHGVAGLVNLYGIESPGLTAALAIAETVAQQPLAK